MAKTNSRKVLKFRQTLHPKFHTKPCGLALGSTFSVRAVDDGLTGAGIMNGDTLRLCRTDTLKPGELAAIATPYGLMIRFYNSHALGYIELHSFNPHFPTLCLHRNDIEIIGRVISLKRNLRNVVLIFEDSKGGAR